jgi:hypothetical protein
MDGLSQLIDQSVHCVRCGTPGVGNCTCWGSRCPCGWYRRHGELCQGPHHLAYCRAVAAHTMRCRMEQRQGHSALITDAGIDDLPLFAPRERQ